VETMYSGMLRQSCVAAQELELVDDTGAAALVLQAIRRAPVTFIRHRAIRTLTRKCRATEASVQLRKAAVRVALQGTSNSPESSAASCSISTLDDGSPNSGLNSCSRSTWAISWAIVE